MRYASVFALVLPSLLVASPAFAEIIDEVAPNNHDSGFLARFAFGLGWENLTIDDGADNELSIGGFGGAVDIGLGAIITPNLALNADIYASTVASPGVSQNGDDLGDAEDTTVSLTSVGLGVTYYIMPLNLYVAGSVGVGKAAIKVQGTTFEADWGLSINGMVGKEFWVSEDWGLGIAGQFIFADVPTDNDNASARYMALNIAFTATYN